MKPSLKMRVLTAAVGVPVIVLILLAPTWVMLCTVILCSLIGIYEFYDAVNMKKEVWFFRDRYTTFVCVFASETNINMRLWISCYFIFGNARQQS